uniref:Collapsin response mediator protein 1 n=1 Tax=Pipistrellus kuhlii TaxID=59472 RepID=A0A7J8B2P2_PIPKU|nr:hypothetical protein mPipKuh1_007922 [Pipistrellus kuhlii]
MADRRRAWNTEDDLPVYLARPGSAAQTPRQKHGGMFAAVEGAYENKTIDFDAYSVGRRGSARTPRGPGQLDAAGLPGPGGSEDTASDVSEPSGSAVSSPGERDERPPALCIRCPAPRDLPLGRDNGQCYEGHEVSQQESELDQERNPGRVGQAGLWLLQRSTRSSGWLDERMSWAGTRLPGAALLQLLCMHLGYLTSL